MSTACATKSMELLGCVEEPSSYCWRPRWESLLRGERNKKWAGFVTCPKGGNGRHKRESFHLIPDSPPFLVFIFFLFLRCRSRPRTSSSWLKLDSRSYKAGTRKWVPSNTLSYQKSETFLRHFSNTFTGPHNSSFVSFSPSNWRGFST